MQELKEAINLTTGIQDTKYLVDEKLVKHILSFVEDLGFFEAFKESLCAAIMDCETRKEIRKRIDLTLYFSELAENY